MLSPCGVNNKEASEFLHCSVSSSQPQNKYLKRVGRGKSPVALCGLGYDQMTPHRRKLLPEGRAFGGVQPQCVEKLVWKTVCGLTGSHRPKERVGDEGRVQRKIQVGGLSGRPCVMISVLWRMSLKGIYKGSGHGPPMMTSLFLLHT